MSTGQVAVERRYSASQMLRALRQRPSFTIGFAIAGIVVAMAALAGVLAPYDPAANDFGSLLSMPSHAHLLGTDDLGRDILSRLMYGSRASVEAGVLATLLA